MPRFLASLLQRSEYLAVERGKIILIPANGDTTTSDTWLKENWLRVATEIISVTGHAGYIYKGYSTGFYTGHKAGGVTLQLYNPTTSQTAFAIFNAELKRARTTRHGLKGTALPKGRFIPGKKSGFVQFWCDMGLDLPKRLSAFHDCMGKLNQLLMTAITNDKDKVINRSLTPLSISHSELINILKSPDNCPTIIRQLPDKQQTRFPDKESAKSHESLRKQENSTTCLDNYGTKVKGITGEGNSSIQLINNKLPQDQTDEEWLDDHARGDEVIQSGAIVQTDNGSNVSLHWSNKRKTPQSWNSLKRELEVEL